MELPTCYQNFVNVCIGCLTISPSSRTEQTFSTSFFWDVPSFHCTVCSAVSKECSAIFFKILLTSNFFCTVTPVFLLCGLKTSPSPFCLRCQKNHSKNRRRVRLRTEKKNIPGFFDLKLFARGLTVISSFLAASLRLVRPLG